jgi:hypothetical protein
MHPSDRRKIQIYEQFHYNSVHFFHTFDNSQCLYSYYMESLINFQLSREWYKYQCCILEQKSITQSPNHLITLDSSQQLVTEARRVLQSTISGSTNQLLSPQPSCCHSDCHGGATRKKQKQTYNDGRVLLLLPAPEFFFDPFPWGGFCLFACCFEFYT